MDKEEAKLILACNTLSEETSDNQEFSEALRMAREDPELMSQWKRQRSFDHRVVLALSQASVPSDLLASVKATVAGGSKAGLLRSVVWRVAAIAACLTLGAYLYLNVIVDRSDDYTGPLIDRAYAYSSDGPRLAYFNKDPLILANWLRQKNFDLPRKFPPELFKEKGVGCRTLEWSEHGVALICFKTDTVYHLFVAFADDFPEVDATGEIAYEYRENGWSVAKWKSDKYVCVLTAQDPVELVAAKLEGYEPAPVS